MIFNAVETAGI